MSKTTTQDPQKWWNAYRNDAERNLFVGKDGASGLCRSEHSWRSTEMLAKEAGITRKRAEEIIDYYFKKGIIIQHAKNPELWGYWEKVGKTPTDPDPVQKDHEDRMNKVGGKKTPAPAPAPAPKAKPAPQPAPAPIGQPATPGGGGPSTPAPAPAPAPAPITKSPVLTTPKKKIGTGTGTTKKP